jgi:hypothetical protein
MKQFLTTVLLLVVIAYAKSQSLQLTSPNGGEVWLGGSVHYITWTYTNVDNIKIEYSLDNGLNWTILSSSYPTSALSYSWTVPCIGSTQVKVRITNTLQFTQDESNAVFTIPEPTVDITYPNGGESFGTGTGQYIEWATTGVTIIKVQYTMDNGGTWTDIGNFPALNNYCNWIAPASLSALARIRAYNIESVRNRDSSTSPFNIVGMLTINSDKYKGGSNDGYNMCSNLPDTIQVLSPNGGEVYNPNAIVNISWSFRHVDNINISFSINNGITWNNIVSNIPASQLSYNWTVPNTPSTQCLLKVSSILGNVYDVSNTNFTILAPQVRMLYPNGGERFGGGTGQYIEWEQSFVSTVKLEYSTDNGSSWNMIGTAPATNLYANWIPPSSISNQCLIRVSDNSSATINDVSDAFFSLYNMPLTDANKFRGGANDGYSMCSNKSDSIRVLSPNGGNVFDAYSTQVITWEYFNVDFVKIEYSSNNGNTWNLIANNVTASLLSYNWLVPSISSSLYLIKVSAVGKNVLDVSNNTFTVRTGFVRLVYPNGGEQFGVGTGQYIEWDYNYMNTVKLEYSADNGLNWNLIGTAPAANKYANWVVPAMALSQTTNCATAFRTYGQGAWGAPAEGDNAGAYLAAHFTDAFPSGIRLGDCGRYLVFNSANAVKNFLPSGTSPRQLNNGTLTNPTRTQYSNVFAGHLLALNLNLTFDSLHSTFSNSSSLLKNAKIATGMFSGWTVQQLYNEANRVIGCGGTNSYINSIKDAVEKVNKSWEEGNRQNEFVNCPSSGLLVKISDNDNPAFSDQSLSAFTSYALPNNEPGKFRGGQNDGYSMCTFKDQYVKVIKPNGGEIWANGSTQKIKWKTLNTTENLKIEYTTDNEATWNLLQNNISQVPDTFNWTISSLPSTTCKVRIKTMSDTIVDKSDDFFTIANPLGIVTNSVGGNTGISREINYGTNLSNNSINGVSFCSKEVMQVNFSSDVNFTGNNHFLVQLSDSAGNFNESTIIIGDLSATIPQPITVTFPDKYEEYAHYRLRVVGTNPPTIGTDNGMDFTIKSLPKIYFGNDTTFCAGSSLTLNSNVNEMQTVWSTGETSSSITVNHSGMYWVKVMNGCGESLDTIIVTEKQKPYVSLAESQTLCLNNPIIIDAENEGASYSWSTGSTQQQITILSPGEYIVFVTNMCGIDSGKIAINSQATVQANLGEDKIMCQSATVYLNAGNEGAAYLWSNGETSQNIAVSAPGTYSVKVNDGCTVSYDQINIYSSNLNSTITAVANQNSICYEQTVQITASGGSFYNWSNGQNLSSISVIPNQTTTYFVQGNNAANCVSSASVTIFVKQRPRTPVYILSEPVSTVLDNGKTYRFTAPELISGDSSNAEASGYQWYIETNTIQPSWVLDSGVLSGPNAGAIRLKYTGSNIIPLLDSLSLSYTSSCGLGDRNKMKLNYEDSTILNVKVYLEGFYRGNGTMAATLNDLGISADSTETDSITVSLWNVASSTNEVYSQKALLHSDGSALVHFPIATLGNSYYIVIRHRNSIETWSASPISISATTSYDFSTGLNKAYGDGVNNPMKNMGGGVYAIYSGDVNQDGGIDISDMQITENDASQFAFGYYDSDCTGDGGSDISDLQIIENNAGLFIFYARPEE